MLLANPGILQELLTPNVEVIFERKRKSFKENRHDIVGVQLDDKFVSVDSRTSNRLMYEALKNRDYRISLNLLKSSLSRFTTMRCATSTKKRCGEQCY